MDFDRIIESLSENDKRVLLSSKERTSVDNISNKIPLDLDTVRASARKLFSLGLINIENETTVNYRLTEVGKRYFKDGLPEYRVLKLLSSKKEIYYSDLGTLGLDKNEINVAVGILKKEGVVETSGNKIILSGDESKIELRSSLLARIDKGGDINNDLVSEFTKRGIITVSENTKEFLYATPEGLELIKSDKFSAKLVDKLTPDIIENWKGLSFRRYDVNSNIPTPIIGRRNIVKEFISIVKENLISMGFKEMKSNFTESIFWNFDVMMFRQDHPDREILDTFYVKDAKAKLEKQLIKKIKETYENGFKDNDFDLSLGYRSEFDVSSSDNVILRAHTTATTFRYIHDLISKNKDLPAKYFSVSKVFRNETNDPTHLPEFYQIEGIVYDDNLNLRDLIGYFYEFYGKLGIKQIRVKPTYNPYTEPSLEIQGFNEKLKRWVEIGNSGVFRPETLVSFGIKKRVIAWGFALERALALRLNLEDIRQLYSPYTDLNFLRGVKTASILD
ncbi:MAG: phenylalanine--tRNA ligase subunit alpha [Candidatus Acidifodinimicrobium sp.]